MRITKKDLERGIKFITERDIEEIYDLDLDIGDVENAKKLSSPFMAEYSQYGEKEATEILRLSDIAEYGGGFDSLEFQEFLEKNEHLKLTSGAQDVMCPEREIRW